jgi:hypothetical protein
MEEKTANQLYKESGSSLSFADWIAREKDKGLFIKNQLLEGITEEVLETPQEKSPARFDIGLPKWAILTGIGILAFAIIYKYGSKKS